MTTGVIEVSAEDVKVEGNTQVTELVIEVKSPIFTVIPVAKGLPRIKIDSDELRSFIRNNTSLNLFSYDDICREDDTEDTKTGRRNRSVKPILTYFSYIENLKEVEEDDFSEDSGVSWQDFKVFVDFVEQQQLFYKELATKSFDSGSINFNSLVLFLQVPESTIAITRGGVIVAFETSSCEIKSSFYRGTFLHAVGRIIANYGKGLQAVDFVFSINEYEGTKTLNELELINLSKDSELTKFLLERADKYLKLTEKPSYQLYQGNLVQPGLWVDKYYKATGRIMIDNLGMRTQNPDFSKYFGFSDEAEENEKKNNVLKVSELNDLEKICCSPYVYGFSFVSKQWGQLNIDNVSDINFRSDAFDKLVLDEDTKDIIHSLVDTEYSSNTDLIDGKGGGCIFLLEGPPGVGKTLTAEAVAEVLERPLYTVGVGELGTNVVELEESLKQILEIATTWNAVLLIDEADIFLAERSDLHIERNAMVGVFLKLLEYYQGVLFLTTNLAGTIDKAFFSRISMAIHYKDLDVQARTSIWNNLLELYQVKDINVFELNGYDLNGRQIKNVIRNGFALAKKQNRNPNIQDFQRVINKTLEFQESMKK